MAITKNPLIAMSGAQPQPERAWWREEGMEPIDELDITQEAIYCTTDNTIGYDPITGENISAISFTGTGCQYRVDVGHIENGEFVVDTAKGTFNSGVTFEEFLPHGENDKRFLLYRFIPNDENHFTTIAFPSIAGGKRSIYERYIICPYVTTWGTAYSQGTRYGCCINEYLDLPLFSVNYQSTANIIKNSNFLKRLEIKRLKEDVDLRHIVPTANNRCEEIIFHSDVTYEPTSLSSAFSSLTSLRNIQLPQMDTSSVTSMASMFQSCTSLRNIQLPQMDTSSVTSMASMFSGCNHMYTIDLSNIEIEDNCTSIAGIVTYANDELVSVAFGGGGKGLTAVTIAERAPSLKYVDMSGLDLVALTGSTTQVSFFGALSTGVSLENIKIPTMHCSFKFSYSTLTHDCLIDAFDRLPILENGEGYTITIGATNIAKLTAEELQVAYNKGWNVA